MTGQAVEIKYIFTGRVVREAWIIQDMAFSIPKVYLLACFHHSKVLRANPKLKNVKIKQ